jgi:hypothetical protein
MSARGAGTQLRFVIVDIGKLRPHEAVEPNRLARLLASIRADGFLRRPIVVEDEFYVILDGHHRYEALRQLGCARVPVYLVHYEDAAIGLTTWPAAVVKSVTKAEVRARGTRGDLFPPKTTRHLLPKENVEKHIRLEELR